MRTPATDGEFREGGADGPYGRLERGWFQWCVVPTGRHAIRVRSFRHAARACASSPCAGRRGTEAGEARARSENTGHTRALVDTNVLVYRFDPLFPDKQATATRLLRDGLAQGTCVIPHQAILEFVAVATRPLANGQPMLPPADAWREAEELLVAATVLYPTEAVVRTALRGAALYQLSWFDAHLWAVANAYGLGEILSEDFQYGRLYGTVGAVNPFLPPAE